MPSYVDDITPCFYGENISATRESLKKAPDLLFQWFSDNHMKANEGKYHSLLSTNKNVLVNIGTT